VCDARDVAAVALAALARAPTGRHYILAGHNLPYLDLWGAMARTAGVKGPLMRAGPVMRWIGATSGDMIGWFLGREIDVNSAGIAMSSQWHYYTSARAQAELGYQSRPFEESLRDAWQWFCDYGYVSNANKPAVAATSD
jgi:dihydroflavonol-4-reductase